jgi:hypothetical protein
MLQAKMSEAESVPNTSTATKTNNELSNEGEKERKKKGKPSMKSWKFIMMESGQAVRKVINLRNPEYSMIRLRGFDGYS